MYCIFITIQNIQTTKQTNNSNSKNTKTKGIASFFQRSAATTAPKPKQETKPAPIKKPEVKVEGTHIFPDPEMYKILC